MNELKDTSIHKDIEKNVDTLKQYLGTEESFDVVIREFEIGDNKAALCYIDAFGDDQIVTLIMQNLVKVERKEIVPNTHDKILQKTIPYTETEVLTDLQDAVDEMLAGQMLLFNDGEDKVIVLDTRWYPARDPEEPEVERITRGSRDGFVETIMFNIGLIRRRIRDPRLRVKPYRIGRRSKTDIALLYMNDITNQELIENIEDEINSIDIDGIPMAEKTVEEYITREFLNPYPQVRYTERADVAAIHLMEGHAVILVDTSPSAIIAPTTLFSHMQHAEEYRQNALVGTYLRWIRYIGIFISLFLAPLWLMFSLEPDLLPEALAFIGPEEVGPIPIAIQFIMAHVFVDLVKLASVHTPTPLATALGLVAAILIGEIAVDVQVFVPEVLLYISIAAVGMFSTPSHEFQMANRVSHLVLLVLIGLFSYYGLLIGLLGGLIFLATTKSFGVPYLWPLIPLNWDALTAILYRKPVPMRNFKRPQALKSKDKYRKDKDNN
ncbi:spore germination protein [Natranaerobius thermophilus]|uniref:GerA spore germination protein n=1 Tax=Natranaerobius thermophilus (strain ATCC BAA-1301 / DSM 18059 / JW/NM-WN-LF) TaxID=457570 RepID=B2A4L0_NATTJ|nr:spore germination protein [Natranaerobius thermophilus]ACB85185.1 GerA spore germination protein [Natranaerobius thermophilus JW/NM-WN-LF]